MKKLVYGSLFLALVGIGVVGCKKNQIEKPAQVNENLKNSNISIPTYQNFDELNRKMKDLEEMSEDERRTFENSNSFISLLTQVYVVYEGIDMETLEHKRDLEMYVLQNSEYIDLRDDGEGEFDYHPYYSDNPYSIIANVERLFVVGNSCFKVFDDGLVVANLENINVLRSLNQIITLDVPENDLYEINAFSIEKSLKSTCHPTFNEGSATSGNNRTRLRCTVGQHKFGEIPVNPNLTIKVYGVRANGQIRPYKRTLGIWYHAKRTISGKIKFEISWKDGTAPRTANIDQIVSPQLKYVVNVPLEAISFPLGEKPKEIKFMSIASWGTTPNTLNATINCQ